MRGLDPRIPTWTGRAETLRSARPVPVGMAGSSPAMTWEGPCDGTFFLPHGLILTPMGRSPWPCFIHPIALLPPARQLDFRQFPRDMPRVRAMSRTRDQAAGPTAPDPDRTTY